MSGFAYRGVVEGFYGPPFPHEDRVWLLERMGAWGLNRYLYAPKDDPWHRERWREPYPEETQAQLRALIQQGRKAGVEMGFAVSPGLSISYACPDDRRVLRDKLAAFVGLGARWLTVAVDDVPGELVHEKDRACFGSLAEAHVALLHELAAGLGSEIELWLVPTDYLGVEPTPYLETLGRELASAIEVAWTGRTVLSPSIRADEAARRAQTLARRPWVWDNVPVSDGPMRGMLHLGPYAHRDLDLAEHVSGVLLNPMERPRASAVAIRTAATYLRDPAGYDPERAWDEALEELGAGDPEAFRIFALAHRFSPLWPGDRDREIEAGFRQLVEAIDRGGALADPLEVLARCIETRLSVAPRLRENLKDRRLAAEIEPWLDSHLSETRRLEAALAAARVLCSRDPRPQKVHAFMRMEARLSRESANGRTSYGPRRVFYPQLSAMWGDRMGLAPDPSLFRARNLADALVEFVEDLALFLLGDPS